MKKHVLSLIVCISVLFSLFVTPVSAAVDANSEGDIIVASTNVTNTNARAASNLDTISSIQYTVDAEGNVFGPQDFCVEGNTVYILDSSDNTIIVFLNGAVSKVIELDDYGIIGTNIAVYNEDIYILCTDINVYKLNTSGVLTNLEIREYLLSEGFSDFRIIDGYLYVCVAEEDIATYKFDLSDTNWVTMVDKFTGMVFDTNTIFYSQPIAEEGDLLGNGMTVTITHLDTETTESFNVYSDYTAFGAQYMGKDNDGNHRVILFELAQNADYTIASAASLRLINSNGSLVGARELDAQIKSIPNQARVIDGEIYFMNAQENRVEVLNLNVPAESTLSSYSSSLDSVTAPSFVQSNAPSVLSAASISRDAIMSTAAYYHTSYSWTCTSINLDALSGWDCPSYVTEPSTYNCMPYCWGKGDDDYWFNLKLANWGYNVGQASSTYIEATCGMDCSGYVSTCWGLGQHYYTDALYSVATIIDFTELQSGDALNSSGHVMLFDYYNTSNGTYILYECTTTNNYDRVAHTSRTASSVEASYTPIRYNNVTG